jgi:hypothetical protein
MVVGGIAVTKPIYTSLDNRIKEIKAKAEIESEMKWADYKGGERSIAYKAVIDLAFETINQKKAQFHVMPVPFSTFSHRRNERRDGLRETSVSLMYYQFVLHRICQFYGPKWGIHIYPDAGRDSAMLPQFRNQLCAAGRKKYETQPNCIRSIQPQCSERHNVLQMVDILIGAIAAKRENRPSAAHKKELANYVLEKSGHRDWAINTPKDARFLTVWNFTW